jgi:hypothetical protein
MFSRQSIFWSYKTLRLPSATKLPRKAMKSFSQRLVRIGGVNNWLGLALGAVLLASCSSSRQGDSTTDFTQHAATRCVREQSEAIAPQRVDLETAVQGVLARCQSQLLAVEREITSRYPIGYRAEMEPGLRRLREVHADAARKFIALARTKGTPVSGNPNDVPLRAAR